MAWFAVYETTSGSLVSLGTVVANPLPNGLTSINVGLDRPTGIWNPVTHVFDAVSSKDPLTRREFYKRFTVAEREALENIRATGTQTQKNKLNAFIEYIADGVELDDVYIISSVNLMENAGVIAPGRAVEVLA